MRCYVKVDNRTWREEEISFNNRPTFNTTTITSVTGNPFEGGGYTKKWWCWIKNPAEGWISPNDLQNDDVSFFLQPTSVGIYIRSKEYSVASERPFFTITYTVYGPLVSFVGTTPKNTIVNSSYAFINITSDHILSSALLEWDGTNITMQGSGTSFYYNKTGVQNGNHTFRLHAEDIGNILNSTETGWVYVNYTGESCSESWNYSNWSVCSGGTQTRTATDLNNCGTTINQSALSASCSVGCSELWNYSDWNTCVNSTQIRTATDLNNCGTTLNKSITSRLCSNNCSELWNYSDWSACVNEVQNRTATDVNNCGTTANISNVNRTCSQNDNQDEENNNPGNDKGSKGGGGGEGSEESGKGTTTVIVNNVIVNNIIVVLVYNTNESSDDIVTRINISLTANVSAPKIVIHNMSIAPVSAPSESVYQYLNITKSNFNNSNIDNAFIDFKVSKKWINANNITRIYLAHYDNGWTNLNTELINSTITHVMYRAHTKGFSYFAVVGENAQKAQASEGLPKEQQLSAVNVPQTASNTPSNTTSYGYVIPAIILLIAVYAAIKWLEKRNNGNGEHTSIPNESKNPETKVPTKSEEVPKQQIQEKSPKIVKSTELDNAQEELEDIKKKLDN